MSKIREGFLEEGALELEMFLYEGLRLKDLNVSSWPAWAAPCTDLLFSQLSMARNATDPKLDPS